MKKIINALKWAWKVYRTPKVFQPSMLQILEAQAKFLEEVADTNKPRMTDLSLIYWEEGEKKEVKILTLWCGVGLGTPLDRIKELAEENQRLKNQLAYNLKINQETKA